MVVKRTDITIKNSSVEIEFKLFETKIDTLLTNQWPQVMHLHNPIITISIGDYSSAVVSIVIKEYTSAGWVVNRVNDQREGDYLEFKK